MLVFAASAQGDSSDYGIESVSASLSTTQAGAHPDVTQAIRLKTDPESGVTFAGTNDVVVALPPGLIGNATKFPACPVAQFVASDGSVSSPYCPADTQIGVVKVNLNVQPGVNDTLTEPLYNLQASERSPARLGFISVEFPVLIDFSVRSDGDYGFTATTRGVTDLLPVNSIETITWGVPSDPIHDVLRMNPDEASNCGYPCKSDNGFSRPSGLGPIPFMTNPASCGPKQVNFALTSYALPGQVFADTASLPEITGCDRLPFEPAVSFAPTTRAADSSSGLDVNVEIPQEGLENANTLAPADLKKVVVALPEGVSLNPSAGNGLGACSEAQVGLISESPVHFNLLSPSCPDSSKIGTARIATPLLPDPIEGSLYLARQGENSFHSLLAGYLVAQGQGITIKLAGRFDVDSDTGRITVIFDNSPQQPLSDFNLHFKGGDRGLLVMPQACGKYDVDTSLVPWSVVDPDHPAAGEVVHRTSVFDIATGPNGGACPRGAFDPKLSARTTNPVAGESSPFVLRLSREDGTGRLGAPSVTLPQGLLGNLKGIPYCSPTALAGISSAVGTGAAQVTSASCPAASQIGTVSIGAGAGPSPFYVNTGRAYMAGPYKGAPLSLATVIPAIAGPFDLGNVVVRTALYVNPRSARIHAVSDPLPTILQGIQLGIRSLTLKLDRPDFTLNPTSCNPMSIAAAALGAEPSAPPAALADRFQVGDCSRLAFKPEVSVRLAGPTHRGAHPTFRTVLTARQGGANIRRVAVTLPGTELFDNRHIGDICTVPQFSAERCPPGAIHGYAKAWTPLLDRPLKGPVYLRASNTKLPDLAVSLGGQIHLDLVGRVDSVRGRLRNTFQAMPDAPLSRVVLTMYGGKKGLFVNSGGLCTRQWRAGASFVAQNAKVHEASPAVKTDCGAK